jgi:hypothetical protein
MNALLHSLHALNPKPARLWDSFEDIDTGLEKFAVRCYYKVVQHAAPNSRPHMAPYDADGQLVEVDIVKVSLVQKLTDEEIDRPLGDFTPDELGDFRDEVEARLNEE